MSVHWVNVELKGDEAKRFRAWLKDMHIKYESSDCGYGYTHFECYMDEYEKAAADKFFNTL